jgi:hypothetical protein
MVEVRQIFLKIEIRTKMALISDFSIPINFAPTIALTASSKILHQSDFPVVLNSYVKSLDY